MLTKLHQLFPIRSNEYIKFALLASIAFLVCANYTLLRIVKETLVITKPEMGIQVIPFLRTWMLMPAMLIFIKSYVMLSARFSQHIICYLFVSFYLIFFALFIFVFYPYEEIFRLESLGRWISSCSIPFAEQFGAMLEYWSFSLYYCLSEIWGTVIVLIIFWGVSNRSNSTEEAKRFYSPLLLITNLSGLFASQISLFLSQSSFKHILFFNQDKWSATLLSITLFVFLCTVCILFLFYLFFKHIRKNQAENISTEKKLSKNEMSLTQIIKVIAAKPAFFSLGIMVFAYFFASGILEFIWKIYLKKVYPNSNDFNDYLSNCTCYISIASTLLALGITGNLIRRFSWRVNAMVSPLVLLVPLLGLVFVNYFWDADPVLFAFFGACYYCLNRICKFTFFDLSKEIATVEMDYADQIKSKTILDGVIVKVAKTSESVVLQVLLLIFGSYFVVIPSLLLMMLGLHCIWAYALREKTSTNLILNKSI